MANDHAAQQLIDAALARYDAQCDPRCSTSLLLDLEERLALMCHAYRIAHPRTARPAPPRTTIFDHPLTRSHDAR